MRILAALALALAACGSPQPPRAGEVGNVSPPDAAPARAPVSCGADTCGPDEYCEERCTCCGMRVPDPGEASGTATCIPLPDSCRGVSSPECDQRTVAIPCA